MGHPPRATQSPTPFWTQPPDAVCAAVASGAQGLTGSEAAARLASVGPNTDRPVRRLSPVIAIGRRVLEPLILLLLFAAGVSAGMGDVTSACIIAAIIIGSIALDAIQEGRAARAAEALKQSVALTAEVRRDGKFVSIPTAEVVPGDVFRVRTGDVIPADALVLEVASFTANEAALTGEPYPVEKRPGPILSRSPADASNALFRGAIAQTGEATALAVATGRKTLFGAVASVLAEDTAPSPFQRDLRALGLVVARAAGVLSVAVLVINLLFGRPLIESLMFAVALAVGLTPELLPMITTVTLSRGAVRMARRRVIVKRLTAIHDLGAMTVLCTDKTGTLTSAEIVLAGSLNASGEDDPHIATLAGRCAELAGDRGAMDGALATAAPQAAEGWTAQGRIGFNYERRRGSVLAARAGECVLICKGAPEAILAVCDRRRAGTDAPALDDAARDAITARLNGLAAQGLRAIAVATKPCATPANALAPGDEVDLIFEGFCTFADPPKESAAAALKRLAAAGVRVNVLSGDDPLVVARIAGLVGLNADAVLAGPELEMLSDEALAARVQGVALYGRLTPDQKVRVVRALQARGETVGFLGDGVNDAPGIRTADVGLSVDGATGVARAAADMILLAPDLNVVADGVAEGRRTFANILKYVRMGSSSNFGNMLSMAMASLFLPFLPLLATQILLNNLLYDLSEIGIPFDTVDPSDLGRPQRWSMRGIVRYAGIMGPLSSVFDGITFVVLLYGFHVAAPEFRTAWFLESIATQILVVFLIRTRGLPWRTPPDPWLLVSALCALSVALVLPFTIAGRWLAFAVPGAAVLLAMGGITAGYLVAAQLVKRMAAGKN
ncbi:magnesium-translocating P-type ATPase [Gluconacetobacter asukensis]|uniref:Magnesium-transporting ATPase, P-type 1 n=1 Tax=Gluconacetobacter asukensis TaxID=1017181 RepID=A0A7W4P0S7_9PROT|nr:magnesium-translocating P-type ATPase [Gluconacetobacter asukensis]MBB2170998.1 magnesium-translocating P-type ATPase [Gluconacetobacter asukensis]